MAHPTLIASHQAIREVMDKNALPVREYPKAPWQRPIVGEVDWDQINSDIVNFMKGRMQ